MDRNTYRHLLKRICGNDPEMVVLAKLTEDPDMLARFIRIEAEAKQHGFDLTEFYDAIRRAYRAGQRHRDTGPE